MLVRSQQAADDGAPEDGPRCVALVAVQPTRVDATRAPGRPRSRADFVAHLIATADRAPQTRTLRRATPADAQAAYQAQQREVPAAGILTRQTI